MLVGAVWAFNDKDACQNDFNEGWTLVVVILAIYFGIIALIVLALFFVMCVICIGSWHISTFLSDEQEYT